MEEQPMILGDLAIVNPGEKLQNLNKGDHPVKMTYGVSKEFQ